MMLDNSVDSGGVIMAIINPFGFSLEVYLILKLMWKMKFALEIIW